MSLFKLEEIEQAVEFVHQKMLPTPQIMWPKICAKVGAEVWVKHENHTPTGSFKARGAITFIDWLTRTHPEIKGIITATRGNHGQGQAKEAQAAGLTAKIIVPKGNSKEKNEAMRAFGGEVIEYGADFDEAKTQAAYLAEKEDLFMVPPFHPQIVKGVATYAFELLTAVKNLDAVYVPIGCGSGICGVITVRDLLQLKTQIIGVVSEQAPAVKQSVEQQKIIETTDARTFADGVAVRVPVKAAFDIYSRGVARVIAVTEDEIAEAMRTYYTDTHNLAEGAGAVALAGLCKEKSLMHGKKVAVILSGSNIDAELFTTVLQNKTPHLGEA